MQTNRFETFIDAIIAIIITILILKISQPAEPTLSAIWDLRTYYLAYLISFLILFNLWYDNHILFQKIDNIDNSVVWIYGIMTFIISLVPYFTIWIALNVESIAAETMFGLIFISTNILHHLAILAIYRSNPYNEAIQKTYENRFYQLTPLIIIFIGFILTYTVFRQGIYISCLLAVIYWICLSWRAEHGN